MRKDARRGSCARAAIVALALGVAVTGCTVTKKAAVKQSALSSGFLGVDYARLTPGGPGEADLRYLASGVDWTSYNAVLLDPVTFWGSEAGKVSPADQQMLCNYFYGIIRAQLAKRFSLATQPGPGVLRIQVAITDAAAATPGLRTISLIIPQAHALDSLKNLTTGSFAFAGGAQVEAKVSDSMTGRALAEGVDRRVGGGNVEAAAQWEWGDVENAMSKWAQSSTDRLYSWTSGASTPAPS